MRVRDRQPELMDAPGLDRSTHRTALRGLRTINKISGTVQAIWKCLDSCVPEGGALRVLDIACGGGDVAIGLAKSAMRAGKNIAITGIDISPTAIDHAREAAAQIGQKGNEDPKFALRPQIQFRQADVLSDEFTGEFDVAYCSLFLHHLDEVQAIQLLQKMKSITRRMAIVDDLRRSRSGYFLAWLGGRLLSRSPLVHVDGPLSVRAAFTVSEAKELALRSGWQGVAVEKRWPQRYTMTMTRS